MSRNGSGTYSLPVGNPVVTGTTISSTWANNTLIDIANALTGSLAADGQTTASGNLNMGTNRIINLADPTSAQDAVTKYYADQIVGTLGTMAYQNANAVAITGGAVTNVALDLHSQTGQMYLPVGPTALRTASPIQGLIRFNTDGPFYEGYQNGNWVKFTVQNQGAYTVNYTIVGGGAGGGTGGSNCGGGGAGQVAQSTTSVIPGTNVLTMVVGAGGPYVTNGYPSSITGVATGAGGSNGNNAGAVGGTSGNGFPGGSGVNVPNGAGGGGGGASAVGVNGLDAGGSTYYGGGGGAGIASTINAVVYGGGGGGGGYNGGGGGGSGGGGNGGINPSTPPTSGTVNSGSGGGGSWASTGASGGSGVVIISMPTANYTGTHTGSPTITTSGSNTILKYTSSGTYTA